MYARDSRSATQRRFIGHGQRATEWSYIRKGWYRGGEAICVRPYELLGLERYQVARSSSLSLSNAGDARGIHAAESWRVPATSKIGGQKGHTQADDEGRLRPYKSTKSDQPK